MAANRQDWCDRACRQIRFKPDRKSVRRELAAHMEDEYEALLASGLGEDEAERRTLANLGDAEETGRLLNRVHKPLLGWLWLVSKVLVILALAVTVFCALSNQWDFYEWSSVSLDADVTEVSRYDLTGSRRLYIEPEGCRAETDGYTFQVERAAVWEYGTGYYELDGWLTVGNIWPWEDAVILNEMYAVDSLGNRYENFRGQSYTESQPLMFADQLGRSPITCAYLVELRDFDPAAQWVELRYDRAGRNLVLHIDLTGGEGA